MRRVVWGLVVAYALCGCSLDGKARTDFSKQFACPENAIAVQERDDLDADELMWGPPTPPPPEVARDPERLALWMKQHAPKTADRTVFHVQGCAHDVFYAYGRSNKSRPMCSQGRYPPHARVPEV